MRGKAWLTLTSVLAGIALTGCSTTPTDAPDKGAQWSYTDDRGEHITTDGPPKNIIAQVSAAGALNDFGVHITGTFGPLKRDDGSPEPEAGSIDPAKVTDVTGPGYGELAMERVAALHPDLLVSGKYAEFEGLWHLTQDQEKTVRKIVPTLGIEQSGRSLPDTIEAYHTLARALGADADSPRVQQDKKQFDAAAQRLRDIGATLREQHRSILGIGGTPEEYFVVDPARNPDLDYYTKELGLPITVPKNTDKAGGGYFERLSWERANAYDADILLWDTRPASLPPKEMKKNPMFARLDAAAHNRFVEWDAVAPLSYASYAKIMHKLADQLEATMRTL